MPLHPALVYRLALSLQGDALGGLKKVDHLLFFTPESPEQSLDPVSVVYQRKPHLSINDVVAFDLIVR